MPPPWWKRLLINLGIPLLTLVSMNSLVGAENSLYSMVAFCCVVLLLCVRGWYYRYQQRQEILKQVYQRQSRSQQQQYETVDTFLKKNRCNTLMATAVCGCVGIDDDSASFSHESPDFCTLLWRTVSALCCGVACRCWCQCCGMCAIAQQDRQLQQDESIQMDYITFEPFGEYSVKLQELRSQQVTSFWKHLENMSLLSYKLLQMLAWSIVVLAVIAILRVERNFTVVNLLVVRVIRDTSALFYLQTYQLTPWHTFTFLLSVFQVIATFFQAFLILYFVHWQWHRFDLSLDAVVKYFSSGFILCTGLAVVLELLVSTLLGIVINIIVLLTALAEQADIPSTPEEAREFARDFQRQHIVMFCFFAFLNAFVVAALVEETVKYFGFFMVEHPDFDNNATRSKETRGVAITIAMVATALGFGCCENLLYVFVYTPPSLANEVATLLARSIFPIHPLAAALQSIGVCRRDLEGDLTVGLGRILFPAILLHGSFDFLLMVMALIQSLQATSDNDDDTAVTDDDATPKTSMVRDELPSLVASVVIVILGLIYYVWQAEAQRIRLHDLDVGGRLFVRETTPLLV